MVPFISDRRFVRYLHFSFRMTNLKLQMSFFGVEEPGKTSEIGEGGLSPNTSTVISLSSELSTGTELERICQLGADDTMSSRILILDSEEDGLKVQNRGSSASLDPFCHPCDTGCHTYGSPLNRPQPLRSSVETSLSLGGSSPVAKPSLFSSVHMTPDRSFSLLRTQPSNWLSSSSLGSASSRGADIKVPILSSSFAQPIMPPYPHLFHPVGANSYSGPPPRFDRRLMSLTNSNVLFTPQGSQIEDCLNSNCRDPLLALKRWFLLHVHHPYPTDADRVVLSRKSGLLRTQVTSWFLNIRKRYWYHALKSVGLPRPGHDQPSEELRVDPAMRRRLLQELFNISTFRPFAADNEILSPVCGSS
jgi:hypothetical protein